MNFTPAKPRGHFNPKRAMYAVKRFWGINPGQLCPKASASRKRMWWRRGWIANEDQLSKEELAYVKKLQEAPTPEPVEIPAGNEAGAPPVQEDGESPEQGVEVSPVSAAEGSKGWWTVTFSDETTRKMRRDDVVALGLLEEVSDGTQV